MFVCSYGVLPCCCVMFLLRLGEGRSHSTLPLQLAKLLGGCGCRWGWHRGSGRRGRGKKARVRAGEDGAGVRMRMGCWREGNYTKVLEVRWCIKTRDFF